MTLPTRPSSLRRQQVFLGYAMEKNISTKAGLSEVTHWSLLTSNLFLGVKGLSITGLTFHEE